MKVKIISDGTHQGTRVVNVETGEPLDMVTYVDRQMGVGGGFHTSATIRLIGVPVEIETNAEIEVEPLSLELIGEVNNDEQ